MPETCMMPAVHTCYIAGTMPARCLCREHIFSNKKISNAIFPKNIKDIEFAAIDKKCGNMKPINMYKKLFHKVFRYSDIND